MSSRARSAEHPTKHGKSWTRSASGCKSIRRSCNWKSARITSCPAPRATTMPAKSNPSFVWRNRYCPTPRRWSRPWLTNCHTSCSWEAACSPSKPPITNGSPTCFRCIWEWGCSEPMPRFGNRAVSPTVPLGRRWVAKATCVRRCWDTRWLCLLGSATSRSRPGRTTCDSMQPVGCAAAFATCSARTTRCFSGRPSRTLQTCFRSVS